MTHQAEGSQRDLKLILAQYRSSGLNGAAELIESIAAERDTLREQHTELKKASQELSDSWFRLSSETEGLREQLAAMKAALEELDNMYAHAWALVDGGLMLMQGSIPRFESAHKKARIALGVPLLSEDKDGNPISEELLPDPMALNSYRYEWLRENYCYQDGHWSLSWSTRISDFNVAIDAA